MSFQMLAPDEVDQYAEDNMSLLIDLREADEYEKNHIKNAQNVPYHSPKWYAWVRKMGNRQKNKKIILYCERGPTSFAAAKELSEKEIYVYVMVGGIKAYRGKIKERY